MGRPATSVAPIVFALGFDLVVALLLGLHVWSLARALTAMPRRGLVRRVILPVAWRVLVALALVSFPFMEDDPPLRFFSGSDLGVVFVALILLLLVNGVVRAVGSARVPHRVADVLPVPGMA